MSVWRAIRRQPVSAAVGTVIGIASSLVLPIAWMIPACSVLLATTFWIDRRCADQIPPARRLTP